MPRKPKPIPEGQLCENGCGQLALFSIPNSTIPGTKERRSLFCCSARSSKCPAAIGAILERRRATSVEKYGTENYQALPTTREKFKTTCQERFGGDAPLASKEVRAKREATNLERYGNAGGMGEVTLKKREETLQERYGVSNVFQLEGVKDKAKETCRERYGSDFWQTSNEGRERLSEALSSEEVIRKRKFTCKGRYGVEGYNNRAQAQITSKVNWGASHHFHSTAWFNGRSRGTKYARKPYTLPSGRTVMLQGFEPQTLDRLFLTLTEEQVSLGVDVPRVSYLGEDGKTHVYFPDIFIPHKNLLIEVKSEYIYSKHKGANTLKQEAARKQGFLHEFWVWDNTGRFIKEVIPGS